MDASSIVSSVTLAASSAEWLSQISFYVYTALGLGFVIFVHELGHFLVAKWCGVKCEKFYIGFDVPMPFGIPSKLARWQWGETEYGVGIIPLGGYVKMLGQDDNPANAAKERERSRLQAAGDGTPATAANPAAKAPGSEAPAAGGDEPFVLDPRSYMAKSVPQRMAIISAGVIMNLIFAVIFAAIAYGVGVKYVPCVIGATVPGDAAWKLDLPPGTKILQLGREGTPNENLRFEHLMKKVFFARNQKEIEMLVRYPTGTEEWLAVELGRFEQTTQKKFFGWKWTTKSERPTIGVTSQFEPKLGKPASFESLPAGKAEPPLAPGDRIVSIAGEPVASHNDLQRVLGAHASETVAVVVARKSEQGHDSEGNPLVEQVTTQVPANPMRWLGFYCELGPVLAVRPGSPAEQAGVKPNDRLLALNGEPLGDAATLGQRLLKLEGKPVEMEVERPSESGPASNLKLSLTPVRPSVARLANGVNRKLGIESLGVAVSLSWLVAHVEPGSPAAAAGLKPGDELLEATFAPASEENAKSEALLLGPSLKLNLQESTLDSLVLHEQVQKRLPDTKVTLVAKRGHELITLKDLTPTAYAAWYNPERGFAITRTEGIHRASSMGEALQLGAGETWDGMSEVARVLSMLVTGRLEVTNLGGPGTIVAAAAGEASEGVSRLLLFLTLLSANLAIINFLPIPVLDGGHFVFLSYEGIFGKPANERVQMGLTMMGLCFLLCLMAFVIGLDVARAFGVM